MNTFFKKTLVAAIVLLSSFTGAFAQIDDYVITNNGDTIKCEINFGEYQISGISKEIKGEEILEYYTASNDTRMRAVFINDKKKMQFLSVVEVGPISLYEIRGGGNGTETKWFISKGSNRVTDFKSNSVFFGKSRQDRKSYFAELLKDKPEVYNKCMADDKFSFKEIRNLVHLYNTGMPYVEPAQVYPNRE